MNLGIFVFLLPSSFLTTVYKAIRPFYIPGIFSPRVVRVVVCSKGCRMLLGENARSHSIEN